jgi:phage regulator Rha-like protein
VGKIKESLMNKSRNKSIAIIPEDIITSRILFLRKKKVMLDRDLAKLYGVETKALNQAVKRNIERFPEDFMFQLSDKEFINWKSQIVTSNQDKMGIRKKPYAFTEHGILMLSSVLTSKKSIEVNIQIMRTFTKLKEILSGHKLLRRKIEEMEKKYDYQFQAVFDAIKKLLASPIKSKKPIGFQ